MTTLNTEEMKSTLLQQRQEIVERFLQHESDWQQLGEPEIEREEEAQKQHLNLLYEQLEGREKKEIEAIDAALRKIDTAEYGTCESCRKRISAERLQALPATLWCRKCAEEKG